MLSLEMASSSSSSNWLIMQADEDAALPDHALAEVRRKLVNIARDIAAAERAAEEVTATEK